MSSYDQHAARDLVPAHRRLAERERAPDDRLRDIAGLLVALAPMSSEAAREAEWLRRVASVIGQAIAAERARQRREADAAFAREGR